MADFKSSLSGKSLEELDGVINEFKKSEEYKVLTTVQGSGAQTSSVQAIEDIIKEAQSQAQPKMNASPNHH